MRTVAEIRHAIAHLDEVIAIDAHPVITASSMAIRDVLKWVLGQKSQFAEVMKECDQIDAEFPKGRVQ